MIDLIAHVRFCIGVWEAIPISTRRFCFQESVFLEVLPQILLRNGAESHIQTKRQNPAFLPWLQAAHGAAHKPGQPMGQDGQRHSIRWVWGQIRWLAPRRDRECGKAPAHGPGGAHHPDKVLVLRKGAGGTDCGETLPAILYRAAPLPGRGPFRWRHMGAVPQVRHHGDGHGGEWVRSFQERWTKRPAISMVYLEGTGFGKETENKGILSLDATCALAPLSFHVA